MKNAAVIALIVAVAAAANAPAQAQTIQERLLGVYSLDEYAPHGDEPTGRISYDASGRMWAMLLPPNREPVEGSSTPEQVRDTMRGVVAYYGSYTIDESTGRVIHHVEAASNPAWIGDDFVRWYRFDGQNLLISLNAEFNNPLVWVRMPDSAAD
jgi:hypothetical protein